MKVSLSQFLISVLFCLAAVFFFTGSILGDTASSIVQDRSGEQRVQPSDRQAALCSDDHWKDAVSEVSVQTDPALSGEQKTKLERAAEAPTIAPWQQDFMRSLARGSSDGPGLHLRPADSLLKSPSDLVTDGSWNRLFPPTGWTSQTAIYDPVRDRMVVFGEVRGDGYSTDIWALSLQATPTWTQLHPSGIPPQGRGGSTAVYDPVHDQMVVFGGWCGGEYFARNETWVLTLGAEPSWRQLPVPKSSPAPGGRANHAAIWDPVRNQMVVFGGIINGHPDFWNDTWMATLSDSVVSWTQLQPVGASPSVRQGHSAIYDPIRDRMVVFGGTSYSNMTFNDVWALSLGSPRIWEQLMPGGTPPSPRSSHAAVYDQARDQMIVFSGGTLNDSWALSLGAGPTWTQLLPSGGLPAGRSGPAAIYDQARDRMVMFGGDSRNDTWTLSLGAQPTWTELFPAGGAPCVRSSPTSIYDPLRNSIVVFGGAFGNTALNDVWMLSLGDATWSRLFPTGTPPPPRSGHVAIYDPIGDRMIVFGGTPDGSGSLNDTWALSLGESPEWTQIFSPTSPPPRFWHTAVFDPLRGRMIVFGGRYSYRWGPTYDDTWALSLNGVPAWTQVSPSGPPPLGRSMHAAIWDPVRDRMIVFGGVNNVYPYNCNDTWALALQGSPEWSQLAPSGDVPSARVFPSAIYDPVRDRMIIFSGSYSSGGYFWVFNDVWSLKLGGNPAWVEMAPWGPLPQARTGSAAVYDPVHDQMVIFGGTVDGLGRCLNDVWGLQWVTSPVAVLISTFDAAASAGGVDLSWEVVSDGEVAGFKIYRGLQGVGASEDITPGGLLAPDARSCRDEGVMAGRTYGYTLAAMLSDRSEVRSQTVTVRTQANTLALYQNYPNPFNPATKISFTVSERARVTLSIYDVEGKQVRTLIDETVGEGYREYVWDGRDARGNPVGSGVYFYRLTAGNRTITKKMVLLR